MFLLISRAGEASLAIRVVVVFVTGR
jgi:hypothetical protein